MLNAIYNIGFYKRQTSKGTNEVEDLLDKDKLKNTKKIFCITFHKNGDEVEYTGIETEDFDDRNILRYLYKRKSSNGPDILPSSLITVPEKTVEKKIVGWFKARNDIPLLRNIYTEITQERNNILNEIKSLHESLPKDEKNNVLLTIKFRENNDVKYLGDYPLFKELLIEQSNTRFYSKHGVESRGTGECYFCNEVREVNGFAIEDSLPFATADKPGFLGNFDQRSRWKEIPVCSNCAISFKQGMEYTSKYLSFKFYGSRYYVTPEIINSDNFDQIFNQLDEEILTYHNKKDYFSGIVSEEDYICDIVGEKGDQIKLTFMFYETKNSRLLVLSTVEDVVPSHLGKIYYTQKEIKSRYPFGEHEAKRIFGKWEGNFINGLRSKSKNYTFGENNWHFRFLRDFTQDNKLFIDMTANILSNKKTNRLFLISLFNSRIRTDFSRKDDYGFKMDVVKSLMLLDFFENMNLVGGERNMNEEREHTRAITDEKIERFFDERRGAFPGNCERASFMVGTLVNYVLWVQRKERNVSWGEEPFRSKLYGLNLDENKIKKVFSQAVEKLSEYKRNYPTLETIVADYLTRAGNNWKLSKDDITYYFSLGMVLGTLFIKDGGEEE